LPDVPLLQLGPVRFYPHLLYRFLYGDGIHPIELSTLAGQIEVSVGPGEPLSLQRLPRGAYVARCGKANLSLAWIR